MENLAVSLWNPNKTKREMKMPNEKQMPDWVKKRHEKQLQDAEARQKYIEGFLRLPVGESEVLINTEKPPEQIQKYGKIKYRYIVTYNGEVKTWDVSSVMDTAITTALMNGINPITVVRIGTGKDDTKYSVKGV